MAESQVPYAYDEPTIASLRDALSEPRFARYLERARGNEAFAFALYLYNARLAKSFLFPLGVAEITLRNAVDGILVQSFGDAWHRDSGFRGGVLNQKSRDSLDTAINRAGPDERSKVVAELTFDFWSNLFRSDYGELWRTKANIAFPGLQHGEGRHEIQNLVKPINRLRNRVAHHEPLLDVNSPDMLSKIIKLVELRCATTAQWMRHHSTVNVVIRTKPNADGSAPVTLESRSDSNFRRVDPSTRLGEIADEEACKCAAFVCMKDDHVQGAFTHQQLAHYLMTRSLEADGMVDLNDHSVGDLLESPAVEEGARLVQAEMSYMDAIRILKKPKTRVVVAVDAESGKAVGVVLRAHRRY